MKSKVLKNDDGELVTKGYLRGEFLEFEKKMDKKFDLILKEITSMRTEFRVETRELHKMREQLYSNDLCQEHAIEDLDGRVLKLETAK